MELITFRSKLLAGGPAFDFASTTTKMGAPSFALFEGREPETPQYTFLLTPQGVSTGVFSQPLSPWRKQYRVPPLQRTQGWGTLIRDGAWEQRVGHGTPARHPKDCRLESTDYNPQQTPEAI